MFNYLGKWIEQLKWLQQMLLKHAEGIANYCQTKVRFGVETVNANIRMLINCG